MFVDLENPELPGSAEEHLHISFTLCDEIIE